MKAIISYCMLSPNVYGYRVYDNSGSIVLTCERLDTALAWCDRNGYDAEIL